MGVGPTVRWSTANSCMARPSWAAGRTSESGRDGCGLEPDRHRAIAGRRSIRPRASSPFTGRVRILTRQAGGPACPRKGRCPLQLQD